MTCAQRRFALMEHVPDWKMHATAIEVSVAEDPPPRTDAGRGDSKVCAREQARQHGAPSGGCRKQELR